MNLDEKIITNLKENTTKQEMRYSVNYTIGITLRFQ